MPAETVRCFVLNGNVTVVTNIDGKVTNVVCEHFARLTHNCMLKVKDSGIAGRFSRRLADRLTGTRASVCEFGEPENSASAKAAEAIGDLFRRD